MSKRWLRILGTFGTHVRTWSIRTVCVLACISLVASSLPLSLMLPVRAYAQTFTNQSRPGQEYYDGDYLIFTEDTTISAPSATSAIVAKQGTVTIEIQQGATLTVIGGAANGVSPAGAGIEVRPGATLIVKGKGSLVAQGGAAALGSSGADGGDGHAQDSDLEPWASGAGGNGGDGGGGAAAGIGSRGGQGGAGGDGARSLYYSENTDGLSGSAGQQGGSAPGCGNIYLLLEGSCTARGGVMPAQSNTRTDQGGDGGWSSMVLTMNDNAVGGGGGGGAGGSGLSAAAIGTGGAGGSGGGGGGGGGTKTTGTPVAWLPSIGAGGGGGGGGGWPNGGGGGSGAASWEVSYNSGSVHESDGHSGLYGGAVCSRSREHNCSHGYCGASRDLTKTSNNGQLLNGAGGSRQDSVRDPDYFRGPEEWRFGGKGMDGGSGAVFNSTMGLLLISTSTQITAEVTSSGPIPEKIGTGLHAQSTGSLTTSQKMQYRTVYNIADCDIEYSLADPVYSGTQKRPEVTAVSYEAPAGDQWHTTNTNVTGYTVAYDTNIDCPTGAFTVTGTFDDKTPTALIGSQRLEFEIEKAPVSSAELKLSSGKPDVQFSPGDEDIFEVLASGGALELDPNRKIHWEVVSQPGAATAELSSSDTTKISVNPTSGGTLVLMCSVSGMSNYNDVRSSISIDVRPTEQETLALQGSKEQVTYGESFDVTADGGSGTGSLSFHASGAVQINADGHVLANDIGDFEVWAERAGDASYTTAESEHAHGVVTPRKTEVTFNQWDPNAQDPYTIVYDGKAHPIEATADNLALGDVSSDVEIKLDIDSARDAGKYTSVVVGAQGAKGKCYEPSGQQTYIIERADNPFSVSCDGFVYDGSQSLTPIVEGVCEQAEVHFEYLDQDDKDAQWTDIPPKDAGTYTIRATSAQTTNYKKTVKTVRDVNIEKASLGDLAIALDVSEVDYGKSFEIELAGSTHGAKVSWELLREGVLDEATEVRSLSENGRISSIRPAGSGVYGIRAHIAESDNYYGATVDTDATIRVLKRSFAQNCIVKITGATTYNGTPVAPKIQVIDSSLGESGYELKEGRDYTIEYFDGVDHTNAAQKVPFYVKGADGYESEIIESTFTIEPDDLGNTSVAEIDDVPYTGLSCEPKPQVSYVNADGSVVLLKEGVDYESLYVGNISPGIGTVILSGLGNFDGLQQQSFMISTKDSDISTARIESVDDIVYDGEAHIPNPKVSLLDTDVDIENSVLLEKDVDYTVSIYDEEGDLLPQGAVDAGSYKLVVEAAGGLTGSLQTEFSIVQRPVTVHPISGQGRDYGSIEQLTKDELKFEWLGDSPAQPLTLNDFTGELACDLAPYSLGSYKISQGTLSLTGKAAQNYKMSFATGYYEIREVEPPHSIPSIDSALRAYWCDPTDASVSLVGELGENGWYRSKVQIKPENGWQISTLGILGASNPWSNVLELPDSDYSAGMSVFLREEDTGSISRAVKIAYRQDTVAPVVGTPLVTQQNNEQFMLVGARVAFIQPGARLSISAQDALSGIQVVEASFDGGKSYVDFTKTDEQSYELDLPREPGLYKLAIRAHDNAGNVFASSVRDIVIYQNPVPTSNEPLHFEAYAPTGEHQPVVQYFENTGNAIAKIRLNNNIVLGESDYSVGYSKDRISLTFDEDFLLSLTAGQYELCIEWNPQGLPYSGLGSEITTSTVLLDVTNSPAHVEDIRLQGDQSNRDQEMIGVPGTTITLTAQQDLTASIPHDQWGFDWEIQGATSRKTTISVQEATTSESSQCAVLDIASTETAESIQVIARSRYDSSKQAVVTISLLKELPNPEFIRDLTHNQVAVVGQKIDPLEVEAVAEQGQKVSYTWYRAASQNINPDSDEEIPEIHGAVCTVDTAEAGNWWYYAVASVRDGASGQNKSAISSAVQITVAELETSMPLDSGWYSQSSPFSVKASAGSIEPQVRIAVGDEPFEVSWGSDVTYDQDIPLGETVRVQVQHDGICSDPVEFSVAQDVNGPQLLSATLQVEDGEPIELYKQSTTVRTDAEAVSIALDFSDTMSGLAFAEWCLVPSEQSNKEAQSWQPVELTDGHGEIKLEGPLALSSLHVRVTDNAGNVNEMSTTEFALDNPSLLDPSEATFDLRNPSDITATLMGGESNIVGVQLEGEQLGESEYEVKDVKDDDGVVRRGLVLSSSYLSTLPEGVYDYEVTLDVESGEIAARELTAAHVRVEVVDGSPVIESLSLSSPSTALHAGESIQVDALLEGINLDDLHEDETGVVWEVIDATRTATNIDEDGLFVADSAEPAGMVTIKATSVYAPEVSAELGLQILANDSVEQNPDPTPKPDKSDTVDAVKDAGRQTGNDSHQSEDNASTKLVSSVIDLLDLPQTSDKTLPMIVLCGISIGGLLLIGAGVRRWRR